MNDRVVALVVTWAALVVFYVFCARGTDAFTAAIITGPFALLLTILIVVLTDYQ